MTSRPWRSTSASSSRAEESKRDVEFSEQNLLDLERGYVMNTSDLPTVGESLLEGRDYLRIDNTHLSAAVVAARVAAEFGLG